MLQPGFFQKNVLKNNKDILTYNYQQLKKLIFNSEKIKNIILGITNDYIPDTGKYLGIRLDKNTLNNIYADFKSYELYIISCGGRSIIDELRYRLGLNPVWVDK